MVFDKLKLKITLSSIIQAPDCSLPFEIMCDAVGAVLGQQKNKEMHDIYYA